jgi:hypothetical protein
MRITVGSGDLGELCGLRLVHSPYFIIKNNSAQFALGSATFQRFPSFWVIIEHILIKYTESIIWSILSEGIPSCSSSLELERKDLKDGVMKSDFQCPRML